MHNHSGRLMKIMLLYVGSEYYIYLIMGLCNWHSWHNNFCKFIVGGDLNGATISGIYLLYKVWCLLENI